MGRPPGTLVWGSLGWLRRCSQGPHLRLLMKLPGPGGPASRQHLHVWKPGGLGPSLGVGSLSASFPLKGCSPCRSGANALFPCVRDTGAPCPQHPPGSGAGLEGRSCFERAPTELWSRLHGLQTLRGASWGPAGRSGGQSEPTSWLREIRKNKEMNKAGALGWVGGEGTRGGGAGA